VTIRLRFLALVCFTLSACKDDGGVGEQMDENPATAQDSAVAPPQDSGTFQLPPWNFPAFTRDAGKPAQPALDASGPAPTTRATLDAKGGSFSAAGIALNVPPGAVTRPTDITFGELPSPPAGFSGRAYLISPPDTKFSKTVQVAIKLTPEQLAQAPANAWAVATLVRGAWVPLAEQHDASTQGDDPKDKLTYVYGSTDTLGPFALVMVTPRVQEPVDAGTTVYAASILDATIDDAGVDASASIASCTPDSCLNGACIQNAAGYSCLCNVGYTTASDLHSCVDVNECAAGLATCRANTECMNDVGTYHCACVAPAVVQADGACVAPPFCKPGACANGSCVEGATDFSCACKPGYAGIKECVDVDECAAGTAVCPLGTHCVNNPGAYHCECNPNTVPVAGGACVVPHCLPGSCIGGACVEGPTDFTCTCGPGYSGSGTQACSNVDECKAGTAVCAAGTLCIDLPGSYHCM
jgi:hypothetical protein